MFLGGWQYAEIRRRDIGHRNGCLLYTSALPDDYDFTDFDEAAFIRNTNALTEAEKETLLADIKELNELDAQMEALNEKLPDCDNMPLYEKALEKADPKVLDLSLIHIYLYFIPRQHMDKVDTFETFIEQLSAINQNDNALSVNNFYIIDDAKQRDKMTEEFYSAVKKEIALYQEKADYLIQSGSRSPSVMERWVGKIATLEQKKQHYEEILRRELDGLDDEFETLRLLSQELSVRANGLRFRKVA